MKEDICSIPVNEVFEPREGCPLCRMRDLLEERLVEYITGAAMMEPDVRIDTNHTGFCHRHFEKMLQTGSRLSNALILESHLKEIETEILGHGSTPGKQGQQRAGEVVDSCFVCREVERGLCHMLETVYVLWQKEPEFRALYQEQPYFCLPHTVALWKGAQRELPRRVRETFIQETKEISERYLTSLREDVTHFCSMFDYRNRGGDFGTSKDAVERAIAYLTSRPMESQK